MPESGSPTTAWVVDVQTGQLAGILPDGSGGGTTVNWIEEQLEEIQQLALYWNLLLAAGGDRFLGADSLGVVASYYGDVLARFYAIASIGVLTMDAHDLGERVQAVINEFVCQLAVDLAVGMAVSSDVLAVMLSDMAGGVICDRESVTGYSGDPETGDGD